MPLTLPPGTELVEVLDSGVILLKETAKSSPQMTELGGTGMSKYGSLFRQEYNSNLRGNVGRIKYNEMRKSDGQAAGLLRLVKTPILAARWYVSPTSDKRKDKKIAEFVHDALFHGTTTSFPQFLAEMLTSLDFGFSAFEKVFKFDDYKGQQMVMWQKFAMRHAMDVERFDYDEHGGPASLISNVGAEAGSPVEIPIDRLLIFTHDLEGGDLEGTSILRPAYKHWYYKENLYKVDAIQKERHGIGIPCIKLPAGFSNQDKLLANELGRNLRTNEAAHVVLPPNWEIMMLKMEGNLTDALASIRHHDEQMVRAILGQFLNSDSAGSITEFMDLFLKSTRFIADQARDVINQHAIRELVDFNFANVVDYPELRVRRLGDTVDWRTLSFAIRNFIGAGAMVPDDVLEKWIREEMDLPSMDTTTQRIVTNLDVMDPAMDPTNDPTQGKAITRQTSPQRRSGTGSASTGKDGTSK
jgi:hypothetical protein